MRKSNSFKSKWVWILTAISGFIYIVAAFLPAFTVAGGKFMDNNPNDVYFGGMCLIIGWMSGLVGSVMFFSWLANLFYFTAILFTLLKKNAGFWFSMVALILSPFLYLETEIMVNEGGHMKDIGSFGIGSYIWISSILILLIASSIQKFKKI